MATAIEEQLKGSLNPGQSHAMPIFTTGADHGQQTSKGNNTRAVKRMFPTNTSRCEMSRQMQTGGCGTSENRRGAFREAWPIISNDAMCKNHLFKRDGGVDAKIATLLEYPPPPM